ncbi:MAG: VWA domain-containing protein [Anaerolineaceae bacterium]|nr:VWA domain-containing protein [Anaerolineaceae bacterium]
MLRRKAGRRSRTRTNRKRGRYIQARPAFDKIDDLAFDATIRAAAPYQKERKNESPNLAFTVHRSDFMRKIRMRQSANLILFVVDASWSMAVAERMEATKGAILSLLTDAYQRRDRVGLIVFQKDRSTLVLPPTNSIKLAQRALKYIPIGGRTPLSAGLQMAINVLDREKILHPEIMPMLIVLTDGAGNVAMGSKPPLEESHFLAASLAQKNIHSVVINMESLEFDQGLAVQLADHLEAPCYSIRDLKATQLYSAVKFEINARK